MKKNTKEEKTQDYGSLRMLLDFGKFKNSETVKFAYNILCLNSKGKAGYIKKAIKHYDQVKENSPLNRLLFDIKIIDYIKKQYNVLESDSLGEILNIDKDSKPYKMLEKRIPNQKEPTNMLCGFCKDDKDAVEMHQRLMAMNVNDRVNLISQAVCRYVYDGFDPKARAILAFKFLKMLIDEYQSADEERKQNILHDVCIIMSFSSEIKPLKKTDIDVKSLSKDIITLFVDEDEIEDFFGGGK